MLQKNSARYYKAASPFGRRPNNGWIETQKRISSLNYRWSDEAFHGDLVQSVALTIYGCASVCRGITFPGQILVAWRRVGQKAIEAKYLLKISRMLQSEAVAWNSFEQQIVLLLNDCICLVLQIYRPNTNCSMLFFECTHKQEFIKLTQEFREWPILRLRCLKKA